MSFKAVLEADIKGFSSNIDKAISDVDRLEKTTLQKLSKVGDSFIGIGKKASILSVALVGVGGKAFSMAADFQDALGATEQIFKDNSDTVQNWANNLDTSYGIAKKEALEYSNLMGSMLINIGNLTEEQASKQSAKLIELAGDLTAMYGGTTQDAVRALTGALKGNNTMLDNYGMAVNDALIKQKALELGLISGTSEMSLQARQAATLALIWEQTGAVQGQAAREADGASGAMRTFRTEVSNLSTELGEVLLPIITPIISKFTDFVGSLRALSPEMQSMIVGVAGVTAVAGPLLIVIGNILKALPLIKAALVALTGPVGLVVGAIVAATALIIANWDKLKVASKNVVDAIISDWDYMSDHFKTVSASIGKVIRGDFAGWWDDVKKTFDTNIEYLKTKWQQLKGIFKDELKININQTALEEALKVNELTGSAGQAKKAVDDLNKSLGDTAEIAELDAFQKLIGEQLNVRDAITKTVSTIEDLQSKLVKLQLGILPSTNVRKELSETQQQINDLSTALDLLTGGRELNIKVNTGSSIMPLIEPTIDAQGLKEKLKDITYGAVADLSEGMQIITIDLTSMLSSTLTDMFGAVSNAIMNGDSVIDALGASLLGTLGGIMVELGQMVIVTGKAIEAVKVALKGLGGFGAIAAGAALIAIGSLFSAGSRKLASSMGSGGAGYSSAPSLRNTGPGYAPSEYRGQYQDDFKVEFKIGTNELVGVLNTAEQRRNRL